MAVPVCDSPLSNAENEIPAGLSGGCFICDVQNDARILFADPNVSALFECASFGGIL